MINDIITSMHQEEKAITAQYKRVIEKDKEALTIFPEDFEVQQQLAMAYMYHCTLKNKDCNEGIQFIDQLIVTYPEDDFLQDIKNPIFTTIV